MRSYEYIITAFALGSTIASATSLAAIAFGEFDLVGPGDTSLPWGIAVVIVVSLAVWWWFWSKVQAAPREVEAKAIPRRVYSHTQLDYVADACARVRDLGDRLQGLEIIWQPVALRHFLCRMRPTGGGSLITT